MTASMIVENEALLMAHIKKHPEFQLAGVCSCGWIGPSASIPGHVGGSNKAAYVKRGWREKHRVVGYTLMGVDA